MLLPFIGFRQPFKYTHIPTVKKVTSSRKLWFFVGNIIISRRLWLFFGLPSLTKTKDDNDNKEQCGGAVGFQPRVVFEESGWVTWWSVRSWCRSQHKLETLRQTFSWESRRTKLQHAFETRIQPIHLLIVPARVCQPFRQTLTLP